MRKTAWLALSGVIVPLMLLAAPLAVSTGCGTFGKTAYRTTATANVTVEAAMSAWGRWVSAHHPPAADELKVKTAFEKYQAAVTTVANTGSIYLRTKNNPNNPDLPKAQVNFNAAVAAAASALADLTNLILSFGIKL